MLEDCNYNKIRLLHDLSRIAWYLEKHGKADASKAGHELCHAMCTEMLEDIERHIKKVSDAVVGLSKEDKFK